MPLQSTIILRGFGTDPKLVLRGFTPGDAPPPPPVPGRGGTVEFNAGTVNDLAILTGQVILGPWQTTDRTQFRIKVHVRGDTTFDLNYEFSTDQGLTWYVGQQAASAPVSVDDGTNYTEEAHFHPNVGYWWRLSIYNTDAINTLNAAFEWRLHEY